MHEQIRTAQPPPVACVQPATEPANNPKNAPTPPPPPPVPIPPAAGSITAPPLAFGVTQPGELLPILPKPGVLPILAPNPGLLQTVAPSYHPLIIYKRPGHRGPDKKGTKRPARTCKECCRTDCRGAKTRVRKGESRECEIRKTR
jgi:hypothetical protein